MKDAPWVDYKQVKEAVTMQMVLEHYGVNWLRGSGDNLKGRCPIHKGEGDRAFNVSLAKNAFNCFSCHAKGNVLDLVAAMEQVSVRDAAGKLQQWFLAGKPAPQQKAPAKRPEPIKEPEVINPPLKFELRVDPEHEYGQGRGLTKETLAYFGAGLCRKGMFAGRFVVPLHNESGQLVGYAGRSIDGAEPKYLFPSAEKGFHKKYLLFNLHRVLKNLAVQKPVVLVEGFFDCMKVHQAGFPCLGILGATLSREQEELLCINFEQVILLFDGDDAGRTATEDCLRRLGRWVFVKAIALPEGEQPDVLNAEELHVLLQRRE